MTRKFILILSILFSIAHTKLYALGLSHIEVYSKLNEPLNAKINILSIPKGDINNIKASLATTEAFRRAGLDRPAILSAIQFQVQATADKSTAVVKVTSAQPLKEPYLNFLVEVTWPSGRILREYTVLLDPPLYEKKLPVITPNTSSSTTETPDSQVHSLSKTPPIHLASSTSKTQRVNSPTTTDPKNTQSSRATNSQQRTTASGKGNTHQVAQNETLWRIAQQTLPAGVSINQHMINIYRANQTAFINRDMNLIQAGKIIQIPGWQGGPLHEPAVAQAAAEEQIASTEMEPTPAPKTAAPSKGETSKTLLSAEPQVVIAPPTAVEKQPGSPGSPSGTDDKQLKALNKQVNELTEKNSSMAAENRELKKELQETKDLMVKMKKQIEDFNKLLELQNKQFAELQQQLSQQNQEIKQAHQELKAAKEQLTQAKITPPPTQVAESAAKTVEPAPKTETPAEDKEDKKAPETEKVATADTPSTSEKTAVPDDSTSPQLTAEKQEDSAPVTPEVEEPAAETAETAGTEKAPTELAMAPKTETTETQAPTPTESTAKDTTPSSNSEPVGPEETGLLKTADDIVQQIPGGWMTVGGVGGGAMLFLLVGGFIRRQKGTESSDKLPEWKEGTVVSEEQMLAELARLESEGHADITNKGADHDLGSVDDISKFMDSIGASETPAGEVAKADEEILNNANVYILYERFEEAEEILLLAIQQSPRVVEYRSKLLELYFNSKETDKFEEQAKQLYPLVGENSKIWLEVKDWWEQLSTGRELDVSDVDSSHAGLLAAGIAGAALGGGIAALALADEDEEEAGQEATLAYSDDQSYEESSLEESEYGLTGEEVPEFTAESEGTEPEESNLDLGAGLDLGELDLGMEGLAAHEEETIDLDLNDSDLDLGFGSEEEALDSADEESSMLEEGMGDELGLDTVLGPVEGEEDLPDDSSLLSPETDDSEYSAEEDPLLAPLGGDDLSTEMEEDSSGSEFEEEPSALESEEEAPAAESTDDDLSLGDDDDLSLDMEEETAPAAESTDDDLSLGDDDDLSLDMEEEETAPAAESTDDDLSLGDDDELSLDMEEEETAPAAESTDDDLSLGDDDELSLDMEEEETAPAAESTDDDLSLPDDDDLSLDMDEETAPAAESTDDDLSLGDDDDLSLDMDEETAPAAESTDDDLSLGDDDDLSLDMEEEETAPAAESTDDDLSLGDDDDLSLDMDEEETASTAESTDDDLSLPDDDDLSLDMEEETAPAAESMDDDLSLPDDDDLSLDIEEETAPAAESMDDDLSLGDDDDLSLDMEEDAASTMESGNNDLLDQMEEGDLSMLDEDFGELEGDDLSLNDSIADEGIEGKFDLAQMYVDMDDYDNARTTLEEIIAEGDDDQQTRAKQLLKELG